MKIEICGPGCANCEKAAEIVRQAVAESGTQADVVKVTDFAAMAKMGVLSTPAVVIDGQIKCVGKVPSKNDVLEWMK